MIIVVRVQFDFLSFSLYVWKCPDLVCTIGMKRTRCTHIISVFVVYVSFHVQNTFTQTQNKLHYHQQDRADQGEGYYHNKPPLCVRARAHMCEYAAYNENN